MECPPLSDPMKGQPSGMQESPLIHAFAFYGFCYLQSTLVQISYKEKVFNNNCKNKQLMNFKLNTILGCMM